MYWGLCYTHILDHPVQLLQTALRDLTAGPARLLFPEITVFWGGGAELCAGALPYVYLLARRPSAAIRH